MKLITPLRILLLFLLLGNNLFSQNLSESKLRIEKDDNWIEYALPEFMNNISDPDNMSPHYFQYDFESTDKLVKNFILVNNSIKFNFDLKSKYVSLMNRKDMKITSKLLKEDRYIVSGNLSNGHILYEFCKVKYGDGYTYSIEYDKSYTDYFNKYIPEIIKCFKIL